MKPADLDLRDVPEQNRYQASQAGKVIAFAEYRPVGNAIMFTHTEVDEHFEGQGVGSALIGFALDDVKSRGLMVIPMCPFVAAFIQRNLGGYLELVQPAHRHIFGL